MNEMATAKEKCYSCGSCMEGKIDSYKYVECGLRSVTLKNILVFHCKECGAVVPEIPNADYLHKLIGVVLLTKDSILVGEEVRFLRKLFGYSVAELAQILGTTKSVISRWENRSTLGKESDRLIRLVCLSRIMKSYVGDSNDAMDNDTEKKSFAEFAATAADRIFETLKKIQNRKKPKNAYIIDASDYPAFSTLNCVQPKADTVLQ